MCSPPPYIHFQHQGKNTLNMLHPESNDTWLELLENGRSYQKVMPAVVTDTTSYYQLDADAFYRAGAGAKIVLTSSAEVRACKAGACFGGTECRKDLALPETIELECSSRAEDIDELHVLHRSDEALIEIKKFMQFYFVYERDQVSGDFYLFIVTIQNGEVSIKRMQITQKQMSALENELAIHDKALTIVAREGGIVFVDENYSTHLLSNQTNMTLAELRGMPMVLEMDREEKLILWRPLQWAGFVQMALWQTIQTWLCCCCNSEDVAVRDETVVRYDRNDPKYFVSTQTQKMQKLVERLKESFNDKTPSRSFVEVILRVLGEEDQISKVKKFVKSIFPAQRSFRMLGRSDHGRSVFILTEAIAQFISENADENKSGLILFFLERVQESRDKSVYEHRLTEDRWDRLLDEAESTSYGKS